MGFCVFVAKKWIEYCKLITEFTVVNTDIEIVSIEIHRLNFRKMVTACVYKPPKGNLENCFKILNSFSEYCQRGNFEIWFLGDFNTDFLRRNDVNTAQLIRFIKKQGIVPVDKWYYLP